MVAKSVLNKTSGIMLKNHSGTYHVVSTFGNRTLLQSDINKSYVVLNGKKIESEHATKSRYVKTFLARGCSCKEEAMRADDKTKVEKPEVEEEEEEEVDIKDVPEEVKSRAVKTYRARKSRLTKSQIDSARRRTNAMMKNRKFTRSIRKDEEIEDDTVLCEDCGKEVCEEFKFCPWCGSKFSAEDVEIIPTDDVEKARKILRARKARSAKARSAKRVPIARSAPIRRVRKKGEENEEHEYADPEGRKGGSDKVSERTETSASDMAQAPDVESEKKSHAKKVDMRRTRTSKKVVRKDDASEAKKPAPVTVTPASVEADAPECDEEMEDGKLPAPVMTGVAGEGGPTSVATKSIQSLINAKRK